MEYQNQRSGDGLIGYPTYTNNAWAGETFKNQHLAFSNEPL